MCCDTGFKLWGSKESSNECMDSLLEIAIDLKYEMFAKQLSDGFGISRDKDVANVLQNHLVFIGIYGPNDGKRVELIKKWVMVQWLKLTLEPQCLVRCTVRLIKLGSVVKLKGCPSLPGFKPQRITFLSLNVVVVTT
ncbi:hypothetical protein V6N13_067196 [Hibiscus sabdariffa]